MRKKPTISTEDSDLFRHAMREIKPLIHTKMSLSMPKLKKTLPRQLMMDPSPLIPVSSPAPSYVSSEEHIEFKQGGVQDKTLRKLRKGQYTVQAILDLHGLSSDDAKAALGLFLQHCLQQEVRVALIIHGKGRHSGNPILKNKINHWLRHIHEVLAFSSATARHGHRGAVYVLLRNGG